VFITLESAITTVLDWAPNRERTTSVGTLTWGHDALELTFSTDDDAPVRRPATPGGTGSS